MGAPLTSPRPQPRPDNLGKPPNGTYDGDDNRPSDSSAPPLSLTTTKQGAILSALNIDLQNAAGPAV